MKRLGPGNLFELEALEQRILLSGDSLLVGLPTVMPDEPEDPFAADLALLPSEEVPLLDSDSPQETSSLYSDPYNPADKIDDLFAGLTEENLFDEGEEEGILEEALDSDSVADESSEGVLENCELTSEEGAAIHQGLEDLAYVGTLLEECNEFATPVPITHDSSIGEFVCHYEILDTRLTTPVYDYFNDATDPPTTDGLLATLQEISSTSNLTVAADSVCGRYDSVSNECCFSLNDSATRKGDVCVQNTTIQRLPLSSRPPLIIGPSETLKGSGHIDGDVFISGVLSPGNSPGVVNISGDLTIDGGDPDVIDDSYSPPSPSGSDTVGEIVIEIGGLTPGPGPANDIDNGYDQIKVTGNVNLGGTLSISLINDFTPTLGDTFEFLSFGSVTGAFDDAIGLFGFGDGSLYLDIVPLTDRLQLVVKQIPASPNIEAEEDIAIFQRRLRMATEREKELALLMDAVYEGRIPDGWSICTKPDNSLLMVDNQSTGLKGIAYENNQTGEIIVAYAGTYWKDWGDWKSDVQLSIDWIPGQFAEAWDLFHAVMQLNSTIPVSLTGHSLGGALAMLIAAQELNLNGTTIPTMVFNAPDVAHLLNDLSPTFDTSKRQLLDGCVTRYTVANDIVGTFTQPPNQDNDYRIGTVIEIPCHTPMMRYEYWH